MRSNSLERYRYFQNPGNAEDTDLSKAWNQNTVGDLGVHWSPDAGLKQCQFICHPFCLALEIQMLRERDRERTICLAGPRVGKDLWWMYCCDFIHGGWGGRTGKKQQIPYGQYSSPPRILGLVIIFCLSLYLMALYSWLSPTLPHPFHYRLTPQKGF